MLRFTHISAVTAVAATSLLLLVPSAHAFDTLCTQAEQPAETRQASSLREKASRFVPQLRVRLWFRPSEDLEQREQARPNALATAPPSTPLPTPLPAAPQGQHNARVRAPYGWQVSVRWDLVEMAEAVHPGLTEAPGELTPTECLQNHNIATRLLLADDGLADDGLADDELADDELEDEVLEQASDGPGEQP